MLPRKLLSRWHLVNVVMSGPGAAMING